VTKKDQEVVEWQLKEKETQAQLQEVGEKLRRARQTQMAQPLEPKKLLTLLPALREWLRSLKKVGFSVVQICLTIYKMLARHEIPILFNIFITN
jgi:hypothetical protein